jgi:hypothetical protein
MAVPIEMVTSFLQRTIKSVMDSDPMFYSLDCWPSIRAKMIETSPGLKQSKIFEDFGHLCFMRIMIEHMEAQKARPNPPVLEDVE